MTEREQMVTDKIAQLLAERDEYNWEFYTDNESSASKDKDIREILKKYRGAADAILNLTDSKGNKLLGVIAEDQSVPKELHGIMQYHRVASSTIKLMLNANFVKLVKEKDNDGQRQTE